MPYRVRFNTHSATLPTWDAVQAFIDSRVHDYVKFAIFPDPMLPSLPKHREAARRAAREKQARVLIDKVNAAFANPSTESVAFDGGSDLYIMVTPVG